MYASKLYQLSPITIQNLLISSKAIAYKKIRESGLYSSALKTLNETQWHSLKEINAFQHNKLSIFFDALKNTAYYRDFLKDSAPNLNTLPLISKTTVNENWEKFINPTAKGRSISGLTSGTSGQALKIIKSIDELRWEQAFITRQLAWAGCQPSDKKAWIRGDMIIPANQSKPPFWRMNYADRKLILSSYHLSRDSASEYIKKLESFNPAFIQAYPSSIHFLTLSLKSLNKKYQASGLKAIVTSSELLTKKMQNDIEEAFGVPVYDWYGNYERVAAIGTCEHGKKHLLLDYSYVELAPADEGRCEIIGTNFYNLSMPLARYRTGDYVSPPIENYHCPCGRNFPIVEYIYGRDDDSIITSDGRSINRIDPAFKDHLEILEVQIVQNDIHSIDVNIIPSANFSSLHEKRLISNLRERIGESLVIRINKVPQVYRTKNGKSKAIICNIKP